MAGAWSRIDAYLWPAASQPASQPAGEPARQPACQPEDFPGAAQRLPRSCLGGEGEEISKRSSARLACILIRKRTHSDNFQANPTGEYNRGGKWQPSCRKCVQVLRCDRKYIPLHRKCSWRRVAGHKIRTVRQKCDRKCIPLCRKEAPPAS